MDLLGENLQTWTDSKNYLCLEVLPLFHIVLSVATGISHFPVHNDSSLPSSQFLTVYLFLL